MATTKLDRFIEKNPEVMFSFTAIDQHDQKDSRLCVMVNGTHLEFPIKDLPNFLKKHGHRLTDGLGLEAASFPFYRADKPIFIESAKQKGVVLYSTPTNSVARYRAEHGLEKDKTVTDAKILSMLREKETLWNTFEVRQPSVELMHVDAEVGRIVVGFRAANKQDSYDPAWADWCPTPAEVIKRAGKQDWGNSLPEIFSLLVQKDSYHPMFVPFFLLTKTCVERSLSKKQFEALARMNNFRFKGRHQIDGTRGSGGIFASLFYHEIVRGEVNKALGLSHLAGIPKQLEALEKKGFMGTGKAMDELRKLRKSKYILARKCVRYIWHRAEETFQKTI
jgi:hypothetical protein